MFSLKNLNSINIGHQRIKGQLLGGGGFQYGGGGRVGGPKFEKMGVASWHI
jgi:hypothetical protein